jgi:hypothetical protein
MPHALLMLTSTAVRIMPGAKADFLATHVAASAVEDRCGAGTSSLHSFTALRKTGQTVALTPTTSQ